MSKPSETYSNQKLGGERFLVQGLWAAAIYAFGSGLVNGGQILLIPLYTRRLSPAEYGALATVNLVSGVAAVVYALGLQAAITRAFYDVSDHREWQQTLAAAAVIVLTVGFLLNLLIEVFAGAAFDRVFSEIRYSPYIRLGLWIGYLNAFAAVPLGLWQAKHQATRFRLSSVLSFLIVNAGMLYWVFLRRDGLDGALRAQLTAAVLMAPVYVFVVAREGLSRPTRQNVMASVMFGIPFALYGLFGLLTNLASRFCLERTLGLSEVGSFSVAQQYAAGLALLTTAISMAWTPIFYRNARTDGFQISVARFGELLVSGLAVVSFAMAALATPLLGLFVPGSYAKIGEYATFLVYAQLLGNGLWVLCVTPIMWSGKTILLAFYTAVSSCVVIAITLLLIPLFGGVGAAIGQIASYAILIGLSFSAANKQYPVPYKYGRMAAPLIGSVCATIIIVGLASYMRPYSPILQIPIALLAIVGFAWSVMRHSGFTLSGIFRLTQAFLANRKQEASLV